MSLRARFATASSAVAFVTLSGALSAVWFVYGAGQERQLDAAVMLHAEQESREASYSAASGPLLHGAQDLASTLEVMYEPDGSPAAWTPSLGMARPRWQDVRRATGSPYDIWWNNEHLRAVLVQVPGGSGRLLWLAAPRTDLDEDDRDLARRMAVAVLIGMAASAALAWWIAGVLTRDHDHIAAVARAVAAGDLSARAGAGVRDQETARLARDIDEMIARLALLLETQQRFIANASHELRSPITTMLGELSFALRRERDAVSYRTSIEEALASARRLKELAEDLLALARAGSKEFEREPVLLAEVAQAAVRSTNAAADASEVRLETSCDGAVVEGHPTDLERLIRNLLENAIRHSPRGGRVRLEALPRASDVQMVVTDEGPGVAPDLRERIFEPFFRCAAARADASGAGLGLAIARSIARAHGGDLWVDGSNASGGARFVVRLPLGGKAMVHA
jgi:two-component system heavy metal sensor histidine kinase CusS